jgi:hypothetical protein
MGIGMKDSLLPNLKNLKTKLLKLNPSDRDGFESLIAVTRREIAGAPFRIAEGGCQGVSSGGRSSFFDPLRLQRSSIPS